MNAHMNVNIQQIKICKTLLFFRLTITKLRYLNASAIIYHIRDEHKNLPEFRFSNQLYVFFLEEPPILTFKHFKVNTFFISYKIYI